MKILRALPMLLLVVWVAGVRPAEASEASPAHDRGGWPLVLAGAAIVGWVARRRLASPY